MNDKYKEVLRFYLLANKLKYKIRSGWDSEHWNINSDRIESVAEHVFGTCILAIGLESEFDFNVDLNKVLKMLVIHELGEVIIGDITPFDGVSLEEKLLKEEEAFSFVVGDLVSKEELILLIKEFDSHETLESKFAYCIDKIEADIQSKIYLDNGFHNSLDEQENNIILKSDKIKDILDGDINNAFDIWYNFDKSIFSNEPVFMELLEYVKNNNLKELV